MLFYQLTLLLGYIYAHALSMKLSTRIAFFFHTGMLFFSIALIALLPAYWSKPEGNEGPVWAILRLLGLSVGFPFLLLSSTSPLIQKWVESSSSSTPYKLYAVSNIGSLLSLLTYPFLVEPNWSLRTQTIAWIGGYLLFCAFTITCSARWIQARRIRPTAKSASRNANPYVLWIALSACGVLLLLAITNQICRDVAVVPFLWVLPLTIYLLTFIFCFQLERFYSRAFFQVILVPAIFWACIVLAKGVDVPIWQQVLVLSLVLFITCTICHGELYLSRPPAEQLTAFYVSLAAGGALGGAFAAILAPLILKDFWELHLGLWLTVACMIAALLADKTSWIHSIRGPSSGKMIRIATALLAFAIILIYQALQDQKDVVHTRRNFYGVLTVLKEDAGTSSEQYTLRHGRIRHGFQFTDPKRDNIPTSYYSNRSGIGLALQGMAERGPLHVGIVGLGIGTIAAYGRTGDTYRFYEIDKDVAYVAQSDYFHFLENCPAKVDIILGDGRISLEREARAGSQQFDLLAIDAFNSDSIPTHLLTMEAMEVYLKHLKPSGVLAFHISNRFLDLQPVIFGNADRFKMNAFLVDSAIESDIALASTWILLGMEDAATKPPAKLQHWTDDHHSIFPLLKWD